MVGETQLRARRTRIRILRAIAERNGSAGFSDIKDYTGLSTGSIYYHLERMKSFVTKDSKQYLITEEGLQFLRESDPKYSGSVTPRKEEKIPPQSGKSEETVRQVRQYASRKYILISAITIAISLTVVLASEPVFSGIANASVLGPATIGIALFGSLVVFRRHSYSVVGYRGTVFSLTALGIVLGGIFVFSGLEFAAAPAQLNDNSMDALLSSYSMHWQVR